MKTIKNLLWLVPLAGLIYMYANQGIGVFLGSTEHFDLLASLGFSGAITTTLVWVSVVIDLGTALLLLFAPNKNLFIFAGVWTWVPRIIAAVGGVENEILESLAVTVLAVLSYLAFLRGHSIQIMKLFTK